MTSKMDHTGFRQALLNWYRQNKRDLPFRRTTDPYKIWLSEIMLQQTTVKTVADYYLRFIKKFPTVACVASAGEQELLTCWQGLGYYSRIRNFKKACEILVRDGRAEVPQCYDELIRLSGVGDYTAAAVASICFAEARAVVDGNVKRVISRVYKYNRDITTGAAKKFFFTKANELLDINHPGGFNQAMMELGAVICQPHKALCSDCPVQSYCRLAGNNPEALPKKIKQDYVQRHYAVFVLQDAAGLLLKKPNSRNLIKNMWELPCHLDARHRSRNGLIKDVFGRADGLKKIKKIGTVRHSITNKKITADIFVASLSGSPLTKDQMSGFKVVARQGLHQIPINTLSRKVLDRLQI